MRAHIWSQAWLVWINRTSQAHPQNLEPRFDATQPLSVHVRSEKRIFCHLLPQNSALRISHDTKTTLRYQYPGPIPSSHVVRCSKLSSAACVSIKITEHWFSSAKTCSTLRCAFQYDLLLRIYFKAVSNLPPVRNEDQVCKKTVSDAGSRLENC